MLAIFRRCNLCTDFNSMLDMTAHDFSIRDKFSVANVSLRDVSVRQLCFVIFFAASQSRLFALLRPIYW